MLQGFLGICVFIIIAYLLSEDKKECNLKAVGIGVVIQFVIAIVFIKIPVFQTALQYLNGLVLVLEKATTAGTSFVFGYLGGGSLPFTESYPGASFILAFRALPLVLVMSALTSLFYYWKIIPWIIVRIARFFEKVFKVGSPEAVGVSANIFVGMVEAPLFVQPYLKKMNRSEIFTLMTCGMATIAGTVMVLYASILSNTIPNIMGHILVASTISVPAAICISKVIIPSGSFKITAGKISHGTVECINSMDAVTKGTTRGIQLVLNITCMIIVLVALIQLINITLNQISLFGNPLTLEGLLGYVLSPFAWLMGIPWSECFTAGKLMGIKTILNELLAYLELSRLSSGELSPRSELIITYAMCGFANPGSLGIMIGGLGAMAPEKRDEVVSLGVKSIIAGTLSTCMTGAVIGIVSVL